MGRGGVARRPIRERAVVELPFEYGAAAGVESGGQGWVRKTLPSSQTPPPPSAAAPALSRCPPPVCELRCETLELGAEPSQQPGACPCCHHGAVPPPEEGPVTVVVRVRPLARSERVLPPVVHVVNEHGIVLSPAEPGAAPGSALPARGPKGKDLEFVFDRVFGEEATQEEVFQHSTSELLDSVLEGYNCSVFAYGATGAGKTYTMLGSEHSPGIMYLTMVELYQRMEARRQEKSCEVLVSYQEVYNEQIYDLLEPKGPLAIREDPERGAVVQGLSFHQPASAEQLLEMLANGNRNRTQHPTDANAVSSRSHAIFQ
ncbi:LOW QUALITY PROTEIN: kinesin-like protein KIF18B, partial [Pezoporus flaviventris]|uniref:LOW QUALITY PROTEIN: kinesin-like protein KIF18B n=1 Tax=Pezoporus flaviventris TaxID=889875 RepID=UPI002AB1A1E3